jgi:hypothetical protein
VQDYLLVHNRPIILALICLSFSLNFVIEVYKTKTFIKKKVYEFINQITLLEHFKVISDQYLPHSTSMVGYLHFLEIKGKYLFTTVSLTTYIHQFQLHSL